MDLLSAVCYSRASTLPPISSLKHPPISNQAICEGWLGIRKGKSSLRSKKQYCVLAKPDGHWVLYIFQTDVATSPKYFINFEVGLCVMNIWTPMQP